MDGAGKVKFDKVRVESIDGQYGRFRVWLNDHELNCVMGVTLYFDPGDMPRAELRLGIDEFDIDEEFVTYLIGKLDDQLRRDD